MIQKIKFINPCKLFKNLPIVCDHNKEYNVNEIYNLMKTLSLDKNNIKVTNSILNAEKKLHLLPLFM